VREVPPVAGLVPLPLHSRRRRERGFNQAEILARRGGGPPVASGLLRRIRSTAQQARRPDAAARLANVAGAFRAVRGPGPGEDPRLGLLDDLVTGGATVAAGADALEAAGWRVAWIAAAGAAAGVLDEPAPRVDTAGAAT
ncbi:ComF family protein, partial [bacterium]|nr:ComF family protein [bacterium]